MSTVEENRLRRQAKRLGLTIVKSRGKKWCINNQLGYMIIDSYVNACVAGSNYDFSLEDVKEWLNDYEERIKK